jgi:hypothetical protein
MNNVRERLLRSYAAAPTVILLFAAVMTVAAGIRFWGYAYSPGCPAVTSDAWITGAAAAVVGAFFLGGLLGKLPHRHPGPNEVAGFGAQLGLTIFTGLIAVAWWYETRALANPDQLPAITSLTLCIKANERDWTLLVFIVGALIAGRWLWHRPGTLFG